MLKLVKFLFLLSALLRRARGQLGVSAVVDARDVSAVVDASNVFAMNLFRVIPDSDITKNRFFSPVSINVALAKILLGSDGETKAQLLKTLHWTSSNETAMHGMLHEFILKLSLHVFTRNKLIFVSRIFVQEGLSLKKEYVDSVRKLYMSTAGKVDFEKRDEARVKINRWVEEATDKAIKRMVGENTISKKTRLMMVDGLDYRGMWLTRFERQVKTRNFYQANNRTLKVRMMKTFGNFFWRRNCSVLRSSLLELPYRGQAVSMVIILPSDSEDISAVEESLSYQNYKDCFSGMMMEGVEVQFPLFRLREEYEMTDPLRALGLENIFTQKKADLSGMSSKKGLHVDRFIHLASMRVQDKGVESARQDNRDRMHKFIVDRPFLFTIQDKLSGGILFIGKVQKPKAPTSKRNSSTKSNEKTPEKKPLSRKEGD